MTKKKFYNRRQVIIVKVWNETVANLTLMALGSSAPEILLSVVEIFAKNFHAGDLGPGTIVGSAAFNLVSTALNLFFFLRRH
jgi:solute carrier family 8 (sodium/calcium exchanger)